MGRYGIGGVCVHIKPLLDYNGNLASIKVHALPNGINCKVAISPVHSESSSISRLKLRSLMLTSAIISRLMVDPLMNTLLQS